MSLLVSVIIPFYKNVTWLKQAVDSVLSQSYKNIEIIIIDDGSKCDLSSFSIPGKIYVYTQINQGAASARNKGIDLAKGDYMAFLDSDDYWDNNKIETQLNLMISNDLVWSHHDYYYFHEGRSSRRYINNQKLVGDVSKLVYTSFRMQTSTLMVRTREMIASNYKFGTLKRNGEDGFLYRQLASNYQLGHLSKPLSYFRIHGNNIGFSPSAQLADRAFVFIKEIKGAIRLPGLLYFAYFLCYVSNEIIVNKLKISKFESLYRFVSYIMYVFPYLVFKLYYFIYRS